MTVSVSFSSSNTEDVSMELFSIDGRKLNTIFQVATTENQNYTFRVGASDLPKGIYISNNGHLPDVPSKNEVLANGIDIAQMDAILLRKIEELTLYMIELSEANEILKKEVAKLKKE